MKKQKEQSIVFGLSEEIVKSISRQKDEPEWVLEKRLKAFELCKNTPMPAWGPDLSGLNLNEIVYFTPSGSVEKNNWNDVPDNIRIEFDKLGIPETEKKIFSGVGAQYDSEVIYHNIQENLKKQGVIFENMDAAVRKYPELVQKYFMKDCVPINDHKFAMLHAAVWSGGTFLYIPKNVKIDLPLQAYFRMNAKRGGQFEHTLIIAEDGSDAHYIEGCSAPSYNASSLHTGCVEIFVHRGARVRYSSIENWSKNTYNLNTKRAIVCEDGIIEWVSGNMGSGTTMLYPSSILRGARARSEMTGVAFAGAGQTQDIGAKAIHAAPYTKSIIRSKSISVGGGSAIYRGIVKVKKNAKESNSFVSCDALILDEKSKSRTYPVMNIETKDSEIAHEARVGRINDDDIFYIMSRGISEDSAIQLVVAGFVDPIVKALPFEYAIEFNKLIDLEMENAVG